MNLSLFLQVSQTKKLKENPKQTPTNYKKKKKSGETLKIIRKLIVHVTWNISLEKK